MVCDIMVSLETTPKLTEVQVRQLFKKMGDEYYHDLIENTVIGGEKGAGTSATMFIDVVSDDVGGRVEGMRDETRWYLDGILGERDIDVSRLDVDVV